MSDDDGNRKKRYSRFWHEVEDTPWHVVSYLIALVVFVITYWFLKHVLELYKALGGPGLEVALLAALSIIGGFLIVQVVLNVWTWRSIVKEFTLRHIDTKMNDAKIMVNAHVQALTDATERAKDLIPLLKGDGWLQAEVDVGNREAEWNGQIWVVVPDLTYEMHPKIIRYYESIAKNLNKSEKTEFGGYFYILPDNRTVKRRWEALGKRLREDSRSANYDFNRLKCYFFSEKELTLRLSMHGLLVFYDPDISRCIAYQYLPPGSDQEYMNIIINGADSSSQNVLAECIASLHQFVTAATAI